MGKSESIGERLTRELGRPVSIAECEREELRIERDKLKSEISDLEALNTRWINTWLKGRTIIPAEPPSIKKESDDLFIRMVELWDEMDEVLMYARNKGHGPLV